MFAVFSIIGIGFIAYGILIITDVIEFAMKPGAKPGAKSAISIILIVVGIANLVVAAPAFLRTGRESKITHK